MKKVFLSLAAIALVATGSLTMTSCGGDDDTTAPAPNPNPNPNPDPNPNPNPTTQSDNTISFEGDEYVIDYQQTGLEYTTYGVGTENEGNGPNIYTSSEEPGVAYEVYTQVTGKIEGNALTDLNVYSYYAINPTVQFNAQGEITSLGQIMSPSQFEDDFQLKSAGLRLGGTVLHNSLGTLNNGSIEYSVYQVGEAVADTDLDFEYNSVASYDATVEFADATFTVKTNNLAGYFYSDLVEEGAKLPASLAKRLSAEQKQILVKAIKDSKLQLIKSNNLKQAKAIKNVRLVK